MRELYCTVWSSEIVIIRNLGKYIYNNLKLSYPMLLNPEYELTMNLDLACRDLWLDWKYDMEFMYKYVYSIFCKFITILYLKINICSSKNDDLESVHNFQYLKDLIDYDLKKNSIPSHFFIKNYLYKKI